MRYGILYIVIFSLTMLVGGKVYAQTAITNNLTQTKNYILIRTPLKSGIRNVADMAGLNNTDMQQTVQYMDDLGRLIQTVQIEGSPLGKDVVQPVVYDTYGRQATQYLPYATTATDGSFKSGAVSAAATFYNPAGTPSTQTQLSNGVAHITAPYAVTIFEPSPMNRVTEQGAAGTTWQPNATPGLSHTARSDWGSNNNDFALTDKDNTLAVQLYKVSIATDGTRTLVNPTGTYADNTLQLTISKDENWQSADGRVGTMHIFTDKQGKVLLRRVFNKKTDGSTEMLSTYYVYDDLGYLCFVLPPGTNPDGGAPSTIGLDETCYQYRYDGRGRMIEKKLPGREMETIVYNKLDQVVMTQNGNQRAKTSPEWTVTKYDVLGRVAVTGLYSYTGTAGTDYRATMQASVDSDADIWEPRISSGNGYSTGTYAAYPTTITTALSINYYDDYDVPSFPAIYDRTSSVVLSKRTMGLPTVSRIKVLDGTGGQANMAWKTLYYDEFGRPLRVFSQHTQGGGTFGSGNYDDVSNTYNFDGTLASAMRSNYLHTGGTPALQVTIITDWDYDHMQRKIKTWQTLDGTKILLSKTNYNEIGQPIEKNLHSTNSGSTFMQSIDYRYNSRGWLSSINNSALSNDGLLNNDTNDAFGMEFTYDTYATAALKQYNGNISSIKWQSKVPSSSTTTQIVQSYEYTYDRINRLTLGNYTTTGLSGRYNEELTYDVSGNIKTLNRYQDISSAATLIDQLTYTYDHTNSHNLYKVEDVSGRNEGQLSGNSYYGTDDNGNQTTNNKQGTTFTYNDFINLPYTVYKSGTGTMKYIYDATGKKVRKEVTGNNHDYIDGIEFDNTGAISFIQTEEGRARPVTGGYSYEYALKDNLGNTRVLLSQSGAVLQQSDYYPFGQQMVRGSVVVPNPDNTYLYNGKELQKDYDINVYDYGARLYDPAIARWTTPDPLAEKNRSKTPYNYVENNPIRLIDPDGMESGPSGNKESDDLMEKWQQAQKAVADKERAAAITAEHRAGVAAGRGNLLGASVEGSEGTEETPNISFGSSNETAAADTTKKGGGGNSNANQGGGLGLGGESAPNSAYTMRDNSVTKETLLDEFLTGKGPTYSGFGPNHPLTLKMKNSLVVNEARLAFLMGGGKAIYNYDASFGLYGIPISAYNGAAQFIGGARVSIIPTSKGLLYILNNTTDRNSAGYHLMDSVPRAPNGVTPGGSIYQRYMWIGPY